MNERVEFDVIINGKNARATLKNVEEDQKRLAKTTVDSNKNMSASWVTLGLKITAAAVAVKASSEAYAKQFKAETSLQAAMKNNASLMDDNINNWKEYASAIQEWSNIGDDVTLQQLAFLNTLQLSDDQMKMIIQTAADVTNGGFMPFDSAVRNLAKSLSGMSGELGELFPSLRELTAEQLKAGEGISVIAEAVRGQSEAIANSPVGKFTALWNTAGDTLESVGETIAEIVDSIGLLDLGSIIFNEIAYQVEKLGIGIQWVAAEIKYLWNRITFDTEEANQAQERANNLNKRYIDLLTTGTSSANKRAEAQKKINTELNLESDAYEKAYQAEMDKIYADELAALGLDAQGEELDKVNKKLKENADAYGYASDATDEYANSINSLSRTLSASEQNGSSSSGTTVSYVAEAGTWEASQSYADWVNLLASPYGVLPHESMYYSGYASGGYTGDVATSSIAGVVHGQEYVVNAQTTKDLGLNGSGGTFDEMNQKLSMLYDVQKSLTKMLRETKENKAYLERIATA